MKYIYSVILLLLFTCIGCTVQYSLSGGTLSPEMQTFSVQFFENRAPLVNPNLSNKFTEDLKQKFRDQTALDEIVGGEGHLNFEGEIKGYATKSMDVQSQEISATNRLTITIKVRFTNEKDEELNFDKSFSAFEDYPSELSFDQVENDLVAKIIEKIIDDIYNESVVNW